MSPAWVRVAVAAFLLSPEDSRAAGTAYAVDTAETTEPGSCKVESWVSSARNRDFFAAVNPACGVNWITQTELSVQGSRSRSDGEWGTALTPKIKMKLSPTEIGTFGWAVTTTASFDGSSSENTFIVVALPGTLRLSENARININPGLLWDRVLDRQFLTYGIGLDVRTSDNIWTLTTEMFGQLGQSPEQPSLVAPRFQVGLRYRPIDAFSTDIILGRNLGGEGSYWLTVGTTIRFSPGGK